MTQPNFSVNANALPSTDFDNLSDEQINQLLNQAAAYKGKSGGFSSAPPPVAPRYTDLDAILKAKGLK